LITLTRFTLIKRFLLKDNLELINQNLVTKSFKSLLEIASFLELNRNL